MYYDIFKELNRLDESQENKLEEVFETHSNLNQKLFDENVLREDVRKQLIKIADMFVDSIKEDQIPIKVYDYWLVGSNAAYNYSDNSDIDVHIIVDINSLGLNPYLISLLYNYIKSSFNDKYDIKVKGHEVELYLEDIETTAVTNGIYSLKQDKWIKEPTLPTETISYNVEETELWNDWYERYLNIDDREAEQFLDDLYMMRKMSLANEGEFGTGNLIFKEFRNRGYLDDLKNKKYKYKSDELTLEKLEEDLLMEATLDYINRFISRYLSKIPGIKYNIDDRKQQIMVETPKTNKFTIPIEDIPKNTSFSKDYKKLRFKGNCRVVDGEMPDPAGGPNTVPVYYGVPIDHKHRDFEDKIKVYELKSHNPSNIPITFSNFILGINKGKY